MVRWAERQGWALGDVGGDVGISLPLLLAVGPQGLAVGQAVPVFKVEE